MEDKKVITVPDGWHEVNIDKFIDIYNVINNIDIKAEDKYIEIASILIDEDPEILRSISINKFTEILKCLLWTNEMPNDAIYKPIIKIDDIEYGLIDRLTKLTVGEWIDLEHYIENAIDNMHYIMAILYRPLLIAYNDRDRVIEEYDANLLEMRANLFKEKMIISDVYGTLVFFSLIARNFMKIIPDYLVDLPAEMQMTMKELVTMI